jgi:hypothetical protein
LRRYTLVCSLLVRAHFGGMRGDVDMLRAGAVTWRRRFLSDQPADAAGSWLEHIEGVFTAAAAAAEAATTGGAPPPLGCASDVDVGVLTKRDVPPAAIDFHVSPIVEELMQQPRVREAVEAAAARAPELLEDNGHDLSGLVRSAMWTHCSSVTNKTPMRPPTRRASPITKPQLSARQTSSITKRQLSAEAGESAGEGTAVMVEDSRQERALATLWASIEDAAASFQRRFIARRFF